MNFKYKALPRKGGPPRKTPTIPVTFIGPSDTVEIMAILDSGADISVLPLEVGQLLGLTSRRTKVLAAESVARSRLQRTMCE